MRTQDTNEGPNPSGLCQCGCGKPTNLARRTEPARGYVKGQPMRFLCGHQRKHSLSSYRIEPETGCWIWLGTIHPKGYGQYSENGKTEHAHRVFYRAHKGDIPPGLDIDHLCRNRACVNPAHLEAVTPLENSRRGVVNTLTPVQVREIRAAAGTATYRALARRYGVDFTTIGLVIQRKTWKDLH